MKTKCQKQIIKYDMHVSCLFVICIAIKDNDNTIQSNVFHLSYMAVQRVDNCYTF